MGVGRDKFDVIVVGGGHAGCEAALAVARLGCSALLITGNKGSIGHMSCNPAIGGLAKGHLVREIDALGGEMGIAADLTGIQFRRLNMTKGPAVRATRCQSDRSSYMAHMQRALSEEEAISVVETIARKILTYRGMVKGVLTDIGEFYADRVILSTGTFLNAILHYGMRHLPGGRENDFAAEGLSDSLRELGFKLGRLKTGTCPRLKIGTIDFSGLEVQQGDNPPPKFSFSDTTHPLPQRECFITYTNERTHQIIKRGLDRSPLFSGKIKGVGPRYCPSIEDKVVRFADKERHQLFLEPEGLDRDEVYVNGLSTSLPEDVQIEVVRSIKGLENAEIARFGYAVEYDFVPPVQLYPSLETKLVKGLYHAGQINGTSGYEEAAAQGLMAGINAARAVRGLEPVVLNRSQAYIGVLIDDLVTKGTNEPYRMFTSRAEHRLILREDNADLRLSKLGYEIGLLSSRRYESFQSKKKDLEKIMVALDSAKVNPSPEVNCKLEKMGSAPLKKTAVLRELIKRPELKLDFVLMELAGINIDAYSVEAREEAEIEIKYEGYLKLQEEIVKRFERLESLVIPEDFSYDKVPNLSNEVRAKLMEIRPRNLGQASRISGITPAAISILMVYLKGRGVFR